MNLCYDRTRSNTIVGVTWYEFLLVDFDYDAEIFVYQDFYGRLSVEEGEPHQLTSISDCSKKARPHGLV